METSSGQEMLEEAKKRKPDALEIRINIQAPRLYFPVRGKAGGGSWFDKVEVELRAMHYVGNSGANLESKHNCCRLYGGADSAKQQKTSRCFCGILD